MTASQELSRAILFGELLGTGYNRTIQIYSFPNFGWHHLWQFFTCRQILGLVAVWDWQGNDSNSKNLLDNHLWLPWSRLHLMDFFTWLFICVFYCILYNKTINLSISLSSVSDYSKLSNQRSRLWEPRSITCWSEVLVTPWDLRLVSDVGAVLGTGRFT